MMKCDLCDNSAVVHEVTVKNGIKNEIHLCEEHARAAGIMVPGEPIDHVISQYVVTKKRRADPSSRRRCKTCGLSIGEFKQQGVLGCADCYDALERPLAAMIERAQNGGTTHVGKSPRRAAATVDGRLRVQSLIKDLECAVASEQYERAAELRDRLREMETREGSAEEPPATAE